MSRERKIKNKASGQPSGGTACLKENTTHHTDPQLILRAQIIAVAKNYSSFSTEASGAFLRTLSMPFLQLARAV